MSRAGGDPLLVTRVDITGNVAPLEKSVEKAKAEIKEVSTESTASASKAAQSATVETEAQAKVTQAYEDKAKAVKGVDQELRQNFSRVVGGAAVVGALGAALNSAIDSFNGFAQAGANAVKEMEAVRAAIGGRIDIQSGITEYEKKIISIQENARKLRRDLGELEFPMGLQAVEQFATGMAKANLETDALRENFGKLTPGFVTAFKEGQEAVIGLRSEMVNLGEDQALSAAVVQKINADAIEQAARLRDLKRELVALQNQELTGIDKIKADTEAAVDAVRERMRGATYDDRTVLLDQLDQIKKNGAIRIQLFEQEQERKREAEEKAAQAQQERERREMERAEQEAARELEREKKLAEAIAKERERADKQVRDQAEAQAKAFAEAYSNTFASLRREAANIFPADQLAGSIERLSELLEALAEQRSRL